MKRIASAAIALLLAASMTPAQAGGAGSSAMQASRQARIQETAARMMRMQAQVQQFNQRLAQTQTLQGFKDLGVGLGIACERLREMERHTAELQEQVGTSASPERIRTLERIQDRLHVINREMDELHEGLQHLVAMPQCPGSPVDAAEQMVRAQHQHEMEQLQTRVQERLRALETWSKGEQVPVPAKEYTKDLLVLRDRIYLMNQTCDKLVEDPQMELDRTRTREIERLRDRLKVVLRELEESGDALETTLTV